MEISLHKDCQIEDLIEYGFRKCGTNYKLNVPLYKYKNIPVITAYFSVSLFDKYIGYDVIDNNSGEIYVHLYNRTYSNPKYNKVLRKVIKELNGCLEKLSNAKIISSYGKVK